MGTQSFPSSQHIAKRNCKQPHSSWTASQELGNHKVNERKKIHEKTGIPVCDSVRALSLSTSQGRVAKHSQRGPQNKTIQVHHVAFSEVDLNFPQWALKQATADWMKNWVLTSRCRSQICSKELYRAFFLLPIHSTPTETYPENTHLTIKNQF